VKPNDNIDPLDSLAYELAAPSKTLKASGMKTWLKQFKVSSRSSTVTGAFVAALLPYDEYDRTTVEDAMFDLGQQNMDVLRCVYCKGHATTWDHLTNLVRERKANDHGHGHRVRNLVPCCAPCNSSKSGTSFEEWILGYVHPVKGRIPGTPRVRSDRYKLVALLNEYQSKCPLRSATDVELETQLMIMRDRVLDILREADELVAKARPIRSTIGQAAATKPSAPRRRQPKPAPPMKPSD
jgi:hypothetical protein